MNPETVDWLLRGGVPLLLLAALIAGWRGWWVYGPTHRDALKACREERDRVLAERDRGFKERDDLLALAVNATAQAKTFQEMYAEIKRP